LNERRSYDSTGEEKFARERYNRVEAIANVTIEGTKNNCIMARYKNPVASTIHGKTKKKRTYAVKYN
jgi:D-hexose-6-phosphate mutarotase